MNLANMVCSKKQALELKLLGIRQDTAFAWTSNYNFPVLSGSYSPNFIAAAFTCAELGEILKKPLFEPDAGPLVCYHQGVWTLVDTEDRISVRKKGSEACARAEMLIRLLLTHRITADEVNEYLGDYITN